MDGSLSRVLCDWAQAGPGRTAFTFLADGETAAATITYGELDAAARAIANHLREPGAQERRVMLVFPPGLDFITAFFACLYAGVTAVPVYPPRSRRLAGAFMLQVRDAAPDIILTVTSLTERLESLDLAVPGAGRPRMLAVDTVDPHDGQSFCAVDASPDAAALMQYTSGSTANPKGVMITHKNLVASQQAIREAFHQNEDSIVADWLPLYHDMGLIGTVLQPVFCGARAILMPPMSFLQRPARWLECISRYRATTGGGPNFAFDLCSRKVSESEKATLDLSSWQVAFNGSEPVRRETMQQFASVFAPCGFRAGSFYSCYGLAEATLLVSAGRVHPSGLKGRPQSAGKLWCDAVVVDAESRRPVAEGQTGEIWVAGLSVASGYWRREAETAETFHARIGGGSGPNYLRTGDLGHLTGGELFVSGRLKDLIIIRGRNYYPADIEAPVARSHRALNGRMGAAFAVRTAREDRIVVVQEAAQSPGLAAIAEAARRGAAEEAGVHIHEVILVREGTLPRTTSGKIRRSHCRELYLDGGTNALARSLSDSDEDSAWYDLAGLNLLPGPERERALESLMMGWVSRRLGLALGPPDLDAPLIALGLDSLQIIELQQETAERAGFTSHMPALREGASIRSICSEMLERGQGGCGLSAGVEAATPLSDGQRSLWFLQSLAQGNSAYHIGGAARIRGPIDATLLRMALEALIRRHAALRTSFGALAGEPFQQVHRQAVVDFGELDAAAAIEERVAQEWNRPFDLGRAPLMRVRVIRESREAHVLVIVLHHLIADLASFQTLVSELGRLVEGQDSSGSVQSDPEMWAPQAARLGEESAERQLAYWTNKLAALPTPLNRSTGRRRPAVPSGAGGSCTLALSPPVCDAVRALASANGVTPFTVLLAAFHTSLHRRSGQTDVVVGVPVTVGRTHQLAGAVGYFVNPLAMRVSIQPADTFADVLKSAGRTVQEALEHREYPFGRIVERLAPARQLGRSPIFQAMFVYQQAGELAAFALGIPGIQMRLGPFELEPFRIERKQPQFDLTISVADVHDRLFASLDYDGDIFDRSTAERMLGQYAALVESVLADPLRAVRDLALLTPEERRQTTVEWNTSRFEHHPRCIHEMFEAQVCRTPDRDALVYQHTRWTYRELNAHASRVASRLRPVGARPETTVGICLTRTPHLVSALIGVLKSGAAYVPFDPDYPAERLRFAAEDADPVVILSERSLLHRLPQGSFQILTIEDLTEAPDSHEDEQTPPTSAAAASPGNLAYLIYTSGSTGRPKAVAIEHRNASALLAWAGREFSLEELAGALASTSINFDLSVFELFAPLCHGGTVILARNALELPTLPARQEVTLINTVPSAMRELLELDALPPSVRTVNLAGEALTLDLAKRVYRRAGRAVRLLNLYGPSESATYSTYAGIGSDTEAAPSIGRPLDNVQAYILDEALNPCAIGVPGELHIAGDALARGYFRRPDATAERFLPNPFSDAAGSRLYRTGDRATWLTSGEIEYLGRTDRQMKIRGFRIEPGEIETALQACPGVREAIVTTHDGPTGDKRLAGYVQLYAPVELASLKAALRSRLPGHMIPAILIPVAEFPRTPNGKLDRAALPPPDWGCVEDRPQFEAAFPGVEERLAHLWSRLLSVATPGRGDNFFDLGGHSLLAVRLAALVRNEFQMEISLRRIFETPVLHEMAAEIEAHPGTAAGGSTISRLNPGESAPLSFAQEQVWLQQALEPASTAYHMAGGLRLSGALDVNALLRSVEWVARKHESLRTRFPVSGGLPCAQIGDGVPPVALVDLTLLPASSREAAELQALRSCASRPIDTARGPLIRIMLFRLHEHEHVLGAVLHHLIADGWSVEILIRELAGCYNELAAGRSVAAIDPPLRYRDFATWQRKVLTGDAVERKLSHWKESLRDCAPALDLPSDRPRPPVRGTRGANVRFEISRSVFHRLEVLGRSEGATPFIILFAALSVQLARWCGGRKRFAIGTPAANRDYPGAQDLIGLFANMLPLPADVSGSVTGRELLRRCRAAALDAYAHQDLPFEILVNAIESHRDPSRNPLFDIALVLDNAPPRPARWSGLEARRLQVLSQAAKYDITFILTQAETISGWLEYNPDLFDAATIARMSGHLSVLLSELANEPDRCVSDLRLLTAAELHQVIEEWNDTAREGSDPRPMVERFEEQATLRPESVAVSDDLGSLTYRELNARANSLAWRLIGEGVAPEVCVGVLASRGVAMIVAWIAIAKAGGAYVPISEGTPTARWEGMLADSNAAVLIAERRLAGDYSGRVICLDEGDWLLEPTLNPCVKLAPGQLAYVLFTSGSTGRPKGVAIEHRGLSNLSNWHNAVYDVGPSDCGAQVASAGFDVAGWEIWPYLAVGARVAVVSEDVKASPPDLAMWLEHERITHTFLVAPLAEQVIEERWDRSSIRALLTGADRLRKRPAPDLAGRVWNNYGPTEASVVSTWGIVDSQGTELPDIGAPIHNMRAYILDQGLQPVPIGALGELYLGGPGLARGYAGRPELTAERFVPDSVSGQFGERLYRTGDLARWGRDGRIRYVGRSDEQVKLRGFRIELGELEAQLAALDGVALASVTLCGEGDRQRLAAFVTGNGADSHRLLAQLRDRVPAYMMPATLQVLDQFPLTSNDKIDRTALSRIAERDVEPTRPAAAPTAIEETIAGFWRELLGELPQRDDGFFQSGGNSLLASRLTARIRKTFEIDFPLAKLFEKPTPALMAAEVEAALGMAPSQAAGAMEPIPSAVPVRISLLQERLWFLSRLDPSSTAYHVGAAVRLNGRLDRAAASAALDAIVERHEILRSVFEPAANSANQRVLGGWRPEFRVADLSHVAPAGRDDVLRRLAESHAKRPFDLLNQPPWRVMLVRESVSSWVLLLTMHHLIADAWTLAVFAREWSSLYRAITGGANFDLPQPLQYRSFSEWHRHWLEGGLMRSQLDWWKLHLRGPLPLLHLPGTKKQAPSESAGASHSRRLPVELVDRLRLLSQNENSTIFMTLLAGFKILLSRYSGQWDVIVGTDVANRNRVEGESAIGFFVNTLALRTDLSGNPPFREALSRVRLTTLGAYAHQDVPFHELVRELNPPREAGGNPVFQILFVLQNAPVPEVDLPGVAASPIDFGHHSAAFDLSVLAHEEPDGAIDAIFRYRPARFDAEMIANLGRDYERFLAHAAERPETPIREFPAIATHKEEAKAVMPGFNGKSRKPSALDALTSLAPQPRSFSVHDLVRTRRFENERALPLVVEPSVPEIDPLAWVAGNSAWVAQRLLEHGGLLFRNFRIESLNQFEEFARAACGTLIEYGERSSPRTSLQGRVYSSTDHPSDQCILLHCEQSYTLEWPMRIWFCCLQPASRGGRTPIASTREITKSLDPLLLDEFDRRGVLYVRNYGGGLGLSWQEAFQTTSPEGVEAYCNRAAIEFEWLGAGRLRTRQRRPALREHPATGERLWFNHALFFHVSSLEAGTRESILAGVAEEDLPNNSYYGDGRRIEPDTLEQIRNAYRKALFSFAWERGDVLMLDNMLAAHGREPFEGARKVAVAMANPMRASAVAVA